MGGGKSKKSQKKQLCNNRAYYELTNWQQANLTFRKRHRQWQSMCQQIESDADNIYTRGWLREVDTPGEHSWRES